MNTTKELANRVFKQDEMIIDWCNYIRTQNVSKEVAKEVIDIKIESIEQIKTLKNDIEKNFDEFTNKRFEKILNKVIEQNEEVLLNLMFLASENI